MSFYFGNPRGFFPFSAGPTVLYSNPYTSNPWGYSSCGPRGCGVSSRTVASPHKRVFDELLEEALVSNLFSSLHVSPQAKFARLFDDYESNRDSNSDESDYEGDEMDYDADCGCNDCGEGECGACGCDDTAAKEPTEPAESSNAPNTSNTESPNISESNERKTEKSVAKTSRNSGVVDVKSFFANDALNFKVDETDEAVTVSSTWSGFDKKNLKVDFHHGALVVSGKAEIEEKDERTGAVSRSSKSVSRTVRLPENIDREGIRAKFKDENSSLTITVPKTKKVEKERETIVIS